MPALHVDGDIVRPLIKDAIRDSHEPFRPHLQTRLLQSLAFRALEVRLADFLVAAGKSKLS
jgi:hypothetical protein